jgi:hypothetical protein
MKCEVKAKHVKYINYMKLIYRVSGERKEGPGFISPESTLLSNKRNEVKAGVKANLNIMWVY